MIDNLLNKLRGSIGTHLQEGEWSAIRDFGKQCSVPGARRRIAELAEENERLIAMLKEWRNKMWPFCEDGWIEGLSGQPIDRQLDWFEGSGANIFTEQRLYKALGKEDARSVLGIWRRFRLIAKHLRAASGPEE